MQYDLIAGWLGLWSEELNLSLLLLRVALSGLFAAIIGCERSSKRHSAGLRTFILVSIAGVAAMLIDQWLMSFSGASLPILSAATALSMATISGMDASGMHLKDVCTEAGYTPQQLCHLLELSASQAIYQWYRGRSLPSTDNLFALAKLLEKHMDELIVEQSFEEE